MKYLKIDDNKGFFRKLENTSEETWIEIDKINKDDLMGLLSKAMEPDFEMDEFNEANLANKAHQIIYKNVFEKFKELSLTKDRFKDESESLYKAAIEKYSEKTATPPVMGNEI
jgi:hypothetical protein